MTKFLLKKLAVIVLLALTVNVFAQNQLLTVGNNSNVMNQAVLALQNDNQTTIRFEINAIELFEVSTDYGQAFIATSDVAPFMLQEGCPEMFYLTSTFIIPDRGSSELEVSYGQFQEFENIEIAPSKGNLLRSVDPSTVPFVKGEVYQRDGFFPGTLASLREPFIMRDIRGQSVDVFPVQYNPVTKVLRVYSEITVSVHNTRNAGVNEFTNQKRHAAIEPEFNAMYNRLFINSSVVQQRGYPTGEAGEILIICHTPWVNEMQPYIDWKRTMGRKTTIVPTSTAGTTAVAIKAFIQQYDDNPANNLAFVLFVGDHAQIPVYPVSGAPSDVEYGKLAGGDNFLEILVGRMSAENVTHVQTQVARTIHYERDLTTADTWGSVGMGVARNEGTGSGHDGGENDYVHMTNIRNKMLTYGYNPVWQEYDGNCPGIPNTTAAQINQRVNDGASVLNYCNHGSPTGWSVANYSNSHVSQLQNTGKWPYLHLVACNNGEFHTGTCFSEVWMRHTYNNQPSGAIAVFGATISIGWQPPMTAQDEFVCIYLDLPSPYSGAQPGTMRTIAGAMLNGSQKMIMVHGSGGVADYNSWLVFGDPALNFRTKTPQPMTISHMPVILIGSTSLTVNCNAEGAVAALSYIDNGEVIIVGVATVTGGVAEIPFTVPVATPMDLTLCVTGFNKVAHLAEISVIPPSGPYVVSTGYSVVGSDVLTYISSNEEIEVTLKNVGIAPTSGTLTATITSNDPQLTINTGTAQHTAVISPDGLATVKFKVTVSNDIVDGKSFPLDLVVTQSGQDPWESKVTLKAYAPKFSLEKVLVNDIEGGSLPKGNLVKITTVIENKGGADAYSAIGELEINDDYITFACEELIPAPQDLPAGETMTLDFYVITSPDMPFGYETNITLLLDAMYGRSHNAPFTLSNTGSASFCIPQLSTGCGSGDRFTSVKLIRNSDQAALINHATPCGTPNGYTDYTSIKVPVLPGEQFTLKVMVGYSSQQMKAWVDANGNNTFETSELLCSGPCGSTGVEYSFPITIPNDFVPGEQRFRLRCTYSTAPEDACSGATWGQTLDYTFIFPELYPRVQNVAAVLQDDAITVTWDAPAEGTPIGYNVYRNSNLLNPTPLTVLTFTEGSIVDGIYVYHVTAVYAGNKESFAEVSNVICNFTPPGLCEEPVDLEGVAEKTTAILTWKKPVNIDGNLLKYNIYRDEVKIDEVMHNVLTYLDKDLDYGTYYYKVSASYGHCSESDLTDGVPVTIVCDMAMPVNLSGKDEEKTAVITWSAPENPEGTLKGYNIYRDGTQINTALVTALEYRDEDLENGTYVYKISAVYEECESELTDGVTVEINFTGICIISTDSFQIFPNPAHSELNIKGNVVPTAVRLYNITGQMVYETIQCTNNMKISVTSMPAGIYFIKIETEYGDVTRKVVVE